MAASMGCVEVLKLTRLFRKCGSFLGHSRHLYRIRQHGQCLSTTSGLRTSTTSTAEKSTNQPSQAPKNEKAQKISRAMKAYLERAQSHDKFMQAEIAEYEIGKRHLANIMGEDPDTFSQEDIDRSLAYLLPSGLYDKKARPHMKHPVEVLPSRKAAQFGMDGRPFHSLFYTGHPNYFQMLHDIAEKFEGLKTLQNNMIAQGRSPDTKQDLHLGGSEWLKKEMVENMLQEKLSDSYFEQLVSLLERIATHPYAYKEKELIMSYRRQLETQALNIEIPPLEYDEAGRGYMETIGKRKRAVARVRIVDKGTGEVSINGLSLIDFFPRIQDREQLMFPLQLTDTLGRVDLYATLEGEGGSAQSGAIRQAVSLALRSFVDRDMVEKMRLAGLLTWDPRTRERKKPGQEGARRKFTWKKR